jgi:Protein of unknown function (DUF3574)
MILLPGESLPAWMPNMTLLRAIHRLFRNRQGRYRVAVGSTVLAIGTLTACTGTPPSVTAASSNAELAQQCGTNGTTGYARTELFFGKSIPGGGTVTDVTFAEFLDQEVTPRFPTGFTVVSAMGQYRETSGVIAREPSAMVILLYPRSSAEDTNRKIDEIRVAYNKSFRQESVLREDEQPSCVSF